MDCFVIVIIGLLQSSTRPRHGGMQILLTPGLEDCRGLHRAHQGRRVDPAEVLHPPVGGAWLLDRRDARPQDQPLACPPKVFRERVCQGVPGPGWVGPRSLQGLDFITQTPRFFDNPRGPRGRAGYSEEMSLRSLLRNLFSNYVWSLYVLEGIIAGMLFPARALRAGFPITP